MNTVHRAENASDVLTHPVGVAYMTQGYPTLGGCLDDPGLVPVLDKPVRDQGLLGDAVWLVGDPGGTL